MAPSQGSSSGEGQSKGCKALWMKAASSRPLPPHPAQTKECHAKPLEPRQVALFGKRAFADVIQDFKMRSVWIINMGPKSSDKSP